VLHVGRDTDLSEHTSADQELCGSAQVADRCELNELMDPRLEGDEQLKLEDILIGLELAQ